MRGGGESLVRVHYVALQIHAQNGDQVLRAWLHAPQVGVRAVAAIAVLVNMVFKSLLAELRDEGVHDGFLEEVVEVEPDVFVRGDARFEQFGLQVEQVDGHRSGRAARFGHDEFDRIGLTGPFAFFGVGGCRQRIVALAARDVGEALAGQVLVPCIPGYGLRADDLESELGQDASDEERPVGIVGILGDESSPQFVIGPLFEVGVENVVRESGVDPVGEAGFGGLDESEQRTILFRLSHHVDPCDRAVQIAVA